MIIHNFRIFSKFVYNSWVNAGVIESLDVQKVQKFQSESVQSIPNNLQESERLHRVYENQNN